MLNKNLPSGYFVPWTKLENTSYLKGNQFDFQLPIYRAFIPKNILPWKCCSVPLASGDESNEDLIHKILINLIATLDPIIILGEEQLLTAVLTKIECTRMAALRKVKLSVCLTKDLALTETIPFVVQYLPDLEAIDYLPDHQVFKPEFLN